MTDRRLIVLLRGGIGNQLFSYAAARRLALANEAELVIDDVSGFLQDSLYRRRYMLDMFNITARRATPRERLEPLGRYRRKLARIMAGRRPFSERRYVWQEGLDFDPRLLDFTFTGSVYLDGNWQSEGYFKDVEDVIRNDLLIQEPQDSANREMAARIRGCEAVCVHVRRYDAKGDPSSAGYELEHGYYARAVALLESRANDPHYFLFSDDPEYAADAVKIPLHRVTCISHNRGDEGAIADLWLMTRCRHFIIANSTFSWWGAWLSTEKARMVISPRFTSYGGVMGWGFRGLIPPEWIVLE
jgi:hypothetical protein